MAIRHKLKKLWHKHVTGNDMKALVASVNDEHDDKEQPVAEFISLEDDD